MGLKDAFKELARFAEARARGATIVSLSPKKTDSGRLSGECLDTITARDFANGWTIKEIIEPAVLRDWTAEDAKKHLGYAFRYRGAQTDAVFIIREGLCRDGQSWINAEYATPIPGTDPAKWDWKPCKVEVPVESPKFNVLTELKMLRHAFNVEFLDRIIKRVEQS